MKKAIPVLIALLFILSAVFPIVSSVIGDGIVKTYEEEITTPVPPFDTWPLWGFDDFWVYHTFDPSNKYILSASLEIRAYDVNSEDYSQRDVVWADGVNLGWLTGLDEQYSISTFTINPMYLADGELDVWFDLDSTSIGSRVEIDYSKLIVEYQPHIIVEKWNHGEEFVPVETVVEFPLEIYVKNPDTETDDDLTDVFVYDGIGAEFDLVEQHLSITVDGTISAGEWGDPIITVNDPDTQTSGWVYQVPYKIYMRGDTSYLYIAAEAFDLTTYASEWAAAQSLGLGQAVNVYIDADNSDELDNNDMALISIADLFIRPATTTTWGGSTGSLTGNGGEIGSSSGVVELKIPYSLIDDVGIGDTIGIAFQAFGYAWYPADAEPTTGPWTEHPENYEDVSIMSTGYIFEIDGVPQPYTGNIYEGYSGDIFWWQASEKAYLRFLDGKGKGCATVIIWVVGTLAEDSAISLEFTIETKDWWTGNQKHHKQSFTSTCHHTLNDGPYVYYDIDSDSYWIQGEPVEVSVYSEEEDADSDGDGWYDLLEVNIYGTDPCDDEDYPESFRLVEKDPDTWDPVHDPVTDGPYGILTYNPSGPTFDFDFEGWNLESEEDYTLIYYADGWPGNNPGAFLGEDTTDVTGWIHITGGIGGLELNMDLPCSPDLNYPAGFPPVEGEGAKIWLVLTDDYDDGTNSMTGWQPTRYLFEEETWDRVFYDDTDV